MDPITKKAKTTTMRTATNERPRPRRSRGRRALEPVKGYKVALRQLIRRTIPPGQMRAMGVIITMESWTLTRPCHPSHRSSRCLESRTDDPKPSNLPHHHLRLVNAMFRGYSRENLASVTTIASLQKGAIGAIEDAVNFHQNQPLTLTKRLSRETMTG